MSHDYTRGDIVRALRQVGVTAGDAIFTHSNVGFFGRLEGADTREDLYRIFREAVFEVVGPDGTWVSPTFSYSFCWKQPYDPDATPGICGMLSELMRADPGALRSEDANFSVAAVGAKAEYLTRDVAANPFGPDSFWDRFLAMGGIIVNFNFDAASTLIHYVERALGVPYRYDKAFEGTLCLGGREQERTYCHFVYGMDKPGDLPQFEAFDAKAKELGLARTADLGKGQIVAISARDTYDLIETELATNPDFLIVAGSGGKRPT